MAQGVPRTGTEVTFAAHLTFVLSYHVGVLNCVTRSCFMCGQTVLHNCTWSVVEIAGNLLVKFPIVLTTCVVLLDI